MEETASITYHSSLAVSQNQFLSFSVKIYSSFHSSQDDVLSESYSCVIEHALWKGRALSVAWSSLAPLQSYERKGLHKPRCNANVHVQLWCPRGLQGKICHILIQNHCLSSFKPLILWRLHKLLTVKLSTPSLSPSVSPSLLIDLICR